MTPTPGTAADGDAVDDINTVAPVTIIGISVPSFQCSTIYHNYHTHNHTYRLVRGFCCALVTCSPTTYTQILLLVSATVQ